MRLNILASFAVVTIALTTGCAANFGESSDDALQTKSGTLDDVAEGAQAPIGDRQTAAVDTHSDQGRTGLDRDIVAYDHVVVPPQGQSTIKDKVEEVQKDQQLKRSFGAASGAREDADEGTQHTSTDGH